jgi:hypothetical protein
MTDTIDRRVAAELDEEQAAEPSATTALPAGPADPAWASRPELWLLAALLDRQADVVGREAERPNAGQEVPGRRDVASWPASRMAPARGMSG